MIKTNSNRPLSIVFHAKNCSRCHAHSIAGVPASNWSLLKIFPLLMIGIFAAVEGGDGYLEWSPQELHPPITDPKLALNIARDLPSPMNRSSFGSHFSASTISPIHPRDLERLRSSPLFSLAGVFYSRRRKIA